MARNFLELKKKAQRNLRLLDVAITVGSFYWAFHLYKANGIGFWVWFWLGFAILSLIMVILNPVSKIENKLMGSIIKGRK